MEVTDVSNLKKIKKKSLIIIGAFLLSLGLLLFLFSGSVDTEEVEDLKEDREEIEYRLKNTSSGSYRDELLEELDEVDNQIATKLTVAFLTTKLCYVLMAGGGVLIIVTNVKI